MIENELERLVQVEDRSKSNQHRIDELEKRADDTEKLVTSVALIAEKQSRMESDVKEMRTDVKKLVEKPGKRWDTAVEKVIYAVLLAVVAWLLAKGGL
jgi:hypothetical protein